MNYDSNLIQAVSIYSWFLSNAFCCCLLGFRIETTHMGKMRRKFTVWGMSNQSAEKLHFEIKDEASKLTTKTTVAGYFFDTYGLELRYVYISCFRVDCTPSFRKTADGRKASASFFGCSVVVLKNNWSRDHGTILQQAFANSTKGTKGGV